MGNDLKMFQGMKKQKEVQKVKSATRVRVISKREWISTIDRNRKKRSKNL